jgi:cysteinyl-tRNA synthetase
MDDDLGTPTALAVLFDTIRDGNRALDAGDTVTAQQDRGAVSAMLHVLGLNPADPEWTDQTGGPDLAPVVDGLLSLVLEQRSQARARKDWQTADAIRDALTRLGLTIEDTPAGPRWSLR